MYSLERRLLWNGRKARSRLSLRHRSKSSTPHYLGRLAGFVAKNCIGDASKEASQLLLVAVDQVVLVLVLLFLLLIAIQKKCGELLIELLNILVVEQSV